MANRSLSSILNVEVEVAIIQAAALLTKESGANETPNLADRYKLLYDAIVDAYNARH